MAISAVSFQADLASPGKYADKPKKGMPTAAKVAIAVGSVATAGVTTLGILAGTGRMPKWMPKVLNTVGDKVSGAAKFVAKKAKAAGIWIAEKAKSAFEAVKTKFKKTDAVK